MKQVPQVERKAKILATLGPSSHTIEQLQILINAGLDVARVNMSHGEHNYHAQTIANLREAAQICGKEVGLLIDLQGPKIRVGKLEKEIELKKDQEYQIGLEEFRTPRNYIPTIYPNLVKDVNVGDRVLFDDGLLRAQVSENLGDTIKIKVTTGGLLKSNKGINLPDSNVSAPSLTEKDREDFYFGLSQGADFVAMSFVRKKEDVLQIKHLLHQLKKNIPVVSKIETPEAVDNLEEILKVSDLLMVARGDLGVEVGNHLVPSYQKKIISLCNEHQVPVITATQMLESMTKNPTPTRAEATDVANAVWDGTDVLMLSGETAVGDHPHLAISMMGKIIKEAEKTPKVRPLLRDMNLESVSASVMMAASMMAEKNHAKYILSVTESGNSCFKVAGFRPRTPVLGITHKVESARRMTLLWGVYPFVLEAKDHEDEEFQERFLNTVVKAKELKNGDKVVVTRGDGKFFSSGSSNSVKVEIINNRPRIPGSSEVLKEGVSEKSKILLDTSICGSCQNCVQICPHDIWIVGPSPRKETLINQERVHECTLDYECIRVCPTGAIEIIPQS